MRDKIDRTILMVIGALLWLHLTPLFVWITGIVNWPVHIFDSLYLNIMALQVAVIVSAILLLFVGMGLIWLIIWLFQ